LRFGLVKKKKKSALLILSPTRTFKARKLLPSNAYNQIMTNVKPLLWFVNVSREVFVSRELRWSVLHEEVAPDASGP